MRSISTRATSILTAAATALALAACTLTPVHTAFLDIEPTQPMVARKIARPLYIVLDPEQVPDEYTVPEGTIKSVTIYEIRSFVRLRLRAALMTFFDDVEVIPPIEDVPPGALVAHVRIQGFGVEAGASHVTAVWTGGTTATAVSSPSAYGRMSWAFAILEPGATSFLFDHSEDVIGSYALTTRDDSPQMMAATYRVALEHLIAKLDQPDVLARLAGAPPATAATAAAAAPAGAP